MNNFREIKKNRLLHDESFSYIISSNERTNEPATPQNLTNFYDINFGGFREPYEEYKVEVLSFACAGGIPDALVSKYFVFIVENLDADGYFCEKKLTKKQIILSTLQINTATSVINYVQNGGVVFKIKNARNVKKVTFKFLRPGFNDPDFDEINDGGETQWILTLKLTPIVDY